MNRIVQVLFGLLILTSCRQNSENKSEPQQINISSVDFKTIDSIKAQSTALNVTGRIAGILVVDTLLVAADMLTDKMLHVISINSHRLLGTILKRGEGPAECLQIAELIPNNSSRYLWTYDITMGKLMKIDLIKGLSDSTYNPEKSYILKDQARGSKSPSWINDSTFAACTYKKEDSRFIIFNSNSKITQQVGRLPATPSDWPKQDAKAAFPLAPIVYSANLRKHPSRDVYVVAYTKTDIMEIYKNGELFKQLIGPDNFKPVQLFKSQGPFITPTNTDETKFAYSALSVSSKYIFALYSGRDNYQTCAQKILIFDWDGKPVQSIALEHPVCSFSIRETKNGHQIFLLNEDNGKIDYITI